MPRPPSDRVEKGFQIWSTDAERNDTRTAELMGVPQSTVSYWHRTYGWDEQYLRLVRPDGELLANVARAEIRAALPAIVTRLQHIVAGRKPIFNADGKQRLGIVARDGDAFQRRCSGLARLSRNSVTRRRLASVSRFASITRDAAAMDRSTASRRSA